MIEIYNEDCLKRLEELEPNSVDSIVTDPPSGTNFNNLSWDTNKGSKENWINWLSEVFIACLKPLKPGSHLLVWAFPRTSHWTTEALERAGYDIRDKIYHHFGTGFPKSLNIDGKGTGLKPATEEWILARKPLEGTIKENYEKYGTGLLNIDDCRIPAGKDYKATKQTPDITSTSYRLRKEESWFKPNKLGRWPANLIVSGDAQDTLESHRKGCSNFFYCPKPSTSERDKGLTNDPVASGRVNKHPTVKPIKFCQYLIRLITPENGTVLDPFCGSGSIGAASILEGRSFIGIEQNKEYFELSKQRLGYYYGKQKGIDEKENM